MSRDYKGKSGTRPPSGKRGGKPVPKKVFDLPYGAKTYRLNRYLAASGRVDSRRKADDEIQKGLVSVNGEVINHMGFTVKVGDTVRLNGRTVYPERNVYFILNKPKNCITTLAKDEKRRKVSDLVAIALKKHPSAFHLGRLDRDTMGLLLFTNDRDLSQSLMHPKYGVLKVYEVDLVPKISQEHLSQLKEHGAILDNDADTAVKITDISSSETPEGFCRVRLSIHSGQNRVVRRMFEALKYEVKRLDRISVGGLTKKGIARGHWRYLKPFEVFHLKSVVSQSRSKGSDDA